ncbi:MAG: c-type cytochrome [Planctomycetaceae bacterium]|nr:c-type cytochrome [Planctomycetaceae bacterium]
MVARLVSVWKLVTLIGLLSMESDVLSYQDQDDNQPAKVIPHNQDGVPNESYTPAQAIAAMKLPPGFTAELVAGEPDLLNPIAMTFDERGRLWVTESFEYPRREAGPGRDRIKILEDTNGDGTFDSVKIFADGLNIPSGIAVGHGGVWVANSPDILFMQDTNGDDRADKTEVVVTGFGRDDTHELPNSLTWGPDGYLYGLNGVFNYSTIVQDEQTYKFTCAMFRIEPKTRQFEVFAEGTSNPWGIAFDDQGEAFVSACVIDHLWHITESGYYLRQAGAYPPNTWVIDSIVDHKHFKAAYCGIHFFDSAAYPENYRKKMYMGNIHGGSINVDEIQRHGSTYRANGNEDILRANDVWFMPVAQKTGPDGCLYVLDWYDRYHCYQDANRDPAGIDRLKGRLYRLRYQESPRAANIDFAKLPDLQLVEKLGDTNVYVRDIAQRILSERLLAGKLSDLARTRLLETIRATSSTSDARRHAMWSLVGGRGMAVENWAELCRHSDPVVQSFAIRGAGNYASLRRDQDFARPWRSLLAKDLSNLAATPLAPTAQVNTIIAARKVLGRDGIDTMLQVAKQTKTDDGLLPRILWQNLLAIVQQHPEDGIKLISNAEFASQPMIADLAPRLAEVLIPSQPLARSLELAARLGDSEAGVQGRQRILQAIERRVLDGGLSPEQVQAAFQAETVDLNALQGSPEFDRLLVSAGAGVDVQKLASTYRDSKVAINQRRATYSTLAFVARDPEKSDALQACLELANETLLSGKEPELANHVIDQLIRLPDSAVAEMLLKAAIRVEPATRARIIEALTSRAESAKALFKVMGTGPLGLTRDMVNETQIQRLLLMDDAELASLISEKWGTMQTGQRGLMIDEITRVRRIVREVPGDFNRGWVVYDRVCGQCHQFAGRGEKVGPAIDSNGRASLSQLLSNMVDPNLVIGTDYQARMIQTTDGRVFSGLVMEDTSERIVLNLQGGKTVTIPRTEIEQEKISPNSLMPEGQTRQMTDQEIADLMSILVLNDGNNRNSGFIPEGQVQEQTQWSVDRFGPVLAEAFAGFTTDQWFDGGLGLLAKHQGRNAVIRTFPVSAQQPTILHRKVQLPAEAMLLKLAVHHHESGAWKLVVRINEDELYSQVVDEAATQHGWLELELDLSAYANQEVQIRLENHSHRQQYAFGYWSHAYLFPVKADLPEMNKFDPNAAEPEYVDRRKQPPVFPVEDGWVKLSPDYPVFVDLKTKRVVVDGQIVQNHALLEMFACPLDSGKEHESVVAVFSSSQLVHAGLLAVGAKPGHPARFDGEFQAATGAKIRIDVQWKGEDGQLKSMPARRMVRSIRDKKELDMDWVFGGSLMYKDPETGREQYLAEGGELICVSNFGTATMDLPTPSPEAAANQMFEANTDQIPPLGTPVRLILTPVQEE